jgi:hypothetical protein
MASHPGGLSAGNQSEHHRWSQRDDSFASLVGVLGSAHRQQQPSTLNECIGCFGTDRQCQVEAAPCLRIVAAHHVDPAHVAKCFDGSRVQSQSFRQATFGLGKAAKHDVGRTGVGPGIRIGSIDLNGFAIEFQRFFGKAEVLPGVAEIVESRGISWLQLDGPFVGRPGILEPLEFKQRDAVIAVRLRRSRLERQSLAQRRLRGLLVPGVDLRNTKQAQRIEIVRLKRQHLITDELGFGEALGAVGANGRGEQFVDRLLLLFLEARPLERPCSRVSHDRVPI